MSLIVDANCACDTLSSTPSNAFAPVTAALLTGRALLIRGGTKLTDEYQRLGPAWRFVLALDKAGRSVTVSDVEVDRIALELTEAGELKSDDPHIIALAQVSGARVLCSKDQNLHADFRDKRFITNPRGSVYQCEDHAPLLRKCKV